MPEPTPHERLAAGYASDAAVSIQRYQDAVRARTYRPDPELERAEQLGDDPRLTPSDRMRLGYYQGDRAAVAARPDAHRKEDTP